MQRFFISLRDEDLRAKVRQGIRMQLLLAFQNQVLLLKYRFTAGSSRGSSEATKQEWLAQLDSMTAFCSINHPCSPFSLSFYDAASYDTGIRYYTKGEPKPEAEDYALSLEKGVDS